MPTRTIADERAAFEAQLPELLESHAGETVLFHGGAPIGFFPDEEQAYEEALTRYGLDEAFLISRITPQGPTPLSIAWSAGVMFG